MTHYLVRPTPHLKGRVRVPGDKSIGHRCLMFGALAHGRSTIRRLSDGLDNRSTAEILRRLGVRIDTSEGHTLVEGVGLDGLRMADGPLDCGNSGTTMRLLAGLLSAQRFGSRLTGDRSLEQRPMKRVVAPLRARGAHIGGTVRAENVYPPLSIAPLVDGESLAGIEYEMPVASAQVKSALLLSGLYARGPTGLKEPTLSRDHTERMMTALGVPLRTEGSMVLLDPNGWERGWDGFDWEVPGDFSSAAFFLAASHVVTEAEVIVEATGMNPSRTGLWDALRLMGAGDSVEWKGDGAGNEPLADLHLTSRGLRGAVLGGELLTRMIDEVPALCAVAAVTPGVTEIRDAAELRVKESDRIAAMSMVLRAFGCSCRELEDGLVIEGGNAIHAATVSSLGDHRIAMAAAVLGLAADGETRVDDVDCVATSFPGFAAMLRSLGADIEERPS